MPDAALDYGEPHGDAELRAELAAYLVRVRGVAPADLVVTGGYTQGLWLTCRALRRAGRDAGGGRGPVAGRLVGDDPVGGPGGRGRAGRRARHAAGRARRRRRARHARAPVPDRRGARARAAAGAAGVGRDRDRGRLRLRVPLRPRAGRDAAAARARPRRLPRHDVEDARARAAARVARWPRRRSPSEIARERWAVDSGGAGDRTPAPTPACSPPARSTATCAAPAASTASAATGWSRRSRRGSRRAASTASPPACTCCCGSRPGPTSARWSARWRSGGSASAGSPATG